MGGKNRPALSILLRLKEVEWLMALQNLKTMFSAPIIAIGGFSSLIQFNLSLVDGHTAACYITPNAHDTVTFLFGFLVL